MSTHFAGCAAAKEGNKVAVICCGWDPGLFSLNRLMGNCFLPEGADYTFWGKGISQGHSDAVRRIEGVADARQYTIPIESALEAARSGENPEFTANVLVAYARAAARLSAEGRSGAMTVFDIAPSYLSIHDGSYLRAHFL